jgi:hypothetical protein
MVFEMDGFLSRARLKELNEFWGNLLTDDEINKIDDNFG